MDASTARPIVAPPADPVNDWYRATFRRIPMAIFRPVSRGRTQAVWMIAAIVGVLATLAGRATSPWVALGVLALGLAGLAIEDATHRWAWPWHRLVLRGARSDAAQIGALLGPTVNRAAAEEWLAKAAGTPAAERMIVLRYLGRFADVESLIEDIAGDGPRDRHRRIFYATMQAWRRTGSLDGGPLRALIPELDEPTRERAATALAYWQAIADVEAGRALRDLRPPAIGPATRAELVDIAWQRLWPARWMLGAFAASWIVLAVLGWIVRH
jgi:hypothetical protein